MAERFVSPGVYTQERDFSFYVSSVGTPSLGLIGETKKGPAFLPTVVESMGEFRELFGSYDTNMHVPYAANSWFKYANSAIVVRVLADSDESVWDVDNESHVLIYATGTGDPSQAYVVAVVMVNDSSDVDDVIISSGGSIYDPFVISALDSGDAVLFSGSVKLGAPNAANSLSKIYPATSGSLTTTFMKVLDLSKGHEIDSSFVLCGATIDGSINGHPFAFAGYSNAQTPVILSDIGSAGEEGTPLFTLKTVSDGNAANREIKIAIENIDTGTSTFDIVVREWNDTDARQVVLERFTRLTMTQSATTYIEKVIGDSRDGTGDYELNSKYIYVEVEAGDHSGRVPAGFRGVRAPGSTAYRAPSWPYKTSYDTTTSTARQYLGVNWTDLEKDHVMYNDFAQWDLTQTAGTWVFSGFHLDVNAASSDGLVVGASGLTGWTKAEAKFLVPVLGGRDGWSRTASRDLLRNNPAASSTLYGAFARAVDELSNPEEFNINVLAMPGVSVDTAISDYARTMVEDRADALYVADMPADLSNAAGAANIVEGIDSNYVATYWPYVQIYDADNAARVWLPPTPQVLEAIAYTDQVAYPWWAAAGMNRGLLTDVINVEYRLTQADRDELYEGKVNPIASFPGQGTVIWGQKTLQTRSTALDRINVRRMLLYVRKVIAGAAKFVVFEPNDEATRDRLQAIIQPVLDLVRIKRGLEDFRIIIDETVNTPDVIDRGQIVAQIFLKPTKAAETIVLYFNITAQGVEFEE